MANELNTNPVIEDNEIAVEANQEHVQMVKKGAQPLKDWLNKHPSVRLQLKNERFTGDLSGVNLAFAECEGCKFTDANLSSANLLGVNLKNATFRNVSLVKANLSFANFSGATLVDTSFVDAKLTNSKFPGAHIIDCDFSDANLNRVSLPEESEGLGFANAGATYSGIFKWENSLIHFPFLTYESLIERHEGRHRQGSRIGFRWQGIFETPQLYYDLLKQLLAYVTWPLVRSVGSLTILTRVSYATLFLIPLLAGVWRAFRSVLQRLVDLSPEENKFILDVNMPDTLAWSFFAAVAVALGHLIFEVWAPPLVKSMSKAELIRDKQASFRSDEAEQRKSLREAIQYIEKIAKAKPDLYHPNLVEQPGGLVWVPSDFGDNWSVTPSSDPDTPSLDPNAPSSDSEATPENNDLRGTKDELGITAIEGGANSQYDLASSTRMPFAFLALISYLCAGAIVLVILTLQASNVGRQAGWW